MRLRKKSKPSPPKWAVPAACAGTAGAVGVVLFAPRRRRKAIVGRVVGVKRHRDPSELNDPALARKVETEIFRSDEVPKGSINVNAENGVVYLRGEANSSEQVEQLAKAARSVGGVREVKNLLHAREG
jgi:osmotically-inducible protein OsmY